MEVERGVSLDLHPLVLHFLNLTKAARVVGFGGLHAFCGGDSVEVHQFASQSLSGDAVVDLNLVAKDSVVVDLAFVVDVLEQPIAELIVLRNEVIAALATDEEVDVSDLGLSVNEQDVLVEEEHVDHHGHELDQESDEESDEASAA